MAEKSKPIQYNVRNSLVNYYLLIMFTIFPLFLTDQYAHARNDKLWFFLILSAILFVAVGGVSIAYASENRRVQETDNTLLPLNPPDIAFLCFFGAAAVSTVFSGYKMDALTGACGRNNGLILLAFYTAVYFIITRFYVFKAYVIAGYLVFSMLVALLTVLNFFYIDPFNIFSGYSDEVIEDFGSTIGNKNTIASFMCLFLPIALALFTIAAKRYMRVLSGCGIALAYTGLLCADSNSGFLGMTVIFIAVALLATRKFKYLKNYALGMTILFASGKALMLFSHIMGDRSKAFEAIPKFLIYSPLSFIPLAFFLTVFGILALLKKDLEPRYNGKILKWIILSLTGVAFAGLLGAFIYYSVIDTETDIGELEMLLRFNDRWGTHRGFMWINGMKEFARFDFIHLLFGSGPDTFYHVFEPHFAELLERFGDSSTDCIHNEYLNYLVTQGIIGLLSYCAIPGTVIFRSVRTSRKNPIAAVFICAVVGYAAQSVVNLYQPITTPTMILFLSIAEAFNRYSDKELALFTI